MSVGPSKFPIYKMIGLQGYLTVWGIPWVPCAQAKNSITEIFSKGIIFEIMPCKKVYCSLFKFSLHSLTASWSEASNLSTNVQLDFSWTLEISDQQNDRFARPTNSLSNSLSTMCASWELFHRKLFANK